MTATEGLGMGLDGVGECGRPEGTTGDAALDRCPDGIEIEGRHTRWQWTASRDAVVGHLS